MKIIIIIFEILAIGLFLTTIVLVILKALGNSALKNYQQDIALIEDCLKNWVVSGYTFSQLRKMFHDIQFNDRDEDRTFKAYRKFTEKWNAYFEQPEKYPLSKIVNN